MALLFTIILISINANPTFITFFPMSFFNKIELHNNFWMYFSLPIDQLHKYPIWLLLFLQNYIVPFLAFAAISIKIVVKSGRVISRELFGINEFQYCTPSPSQSRDVTAGTTIATAVAPTFSDNLTLFQPGGQILLDFSFGYVPG